MRKGMHKAWLSAGMSALVSAGFFSALPLNAAGAGAVVINEICTKNTVSAAPDGQFYDFVELYNPGSTAVSVAGWGLSDNPDAPLSYTLPAGTSVPAKSYLTVWCGIDTTSGVAGASFGLSKKGETVVLSDASGNILEQVEVPALDDNTSFGRVPDGSDTFAVLNELSAGKSNPQSAAGQIAVEKPVFSQGSGFYDAGFNLTLTAKSGCTIYYTTDGSDPTTASEKYTSAIPVRDVSSEPNVYAARTDIGDSYTPPSEPIDKAIIVRAIAVDANGNVSDIVTNSYFVGYEQGGYARSMRVISLVTDPDNLFDYETGIYVTGKIRAEQGQTGFNPMGGIVPANYTQSGREWERPAHITVFEQGKATYSAGVGIRIHGAYTRSAAQKSFNLYARSDYGTTKLEYDFFNGALTDVNGKAITKFDKLTLRNGGNDNKTLVRDRLNQELLADRSFGTQEQTLCCVFLDGEFWGAYNIVEKIGKEYVADHYDVKEKDVCFVKTDELSDGSEQGWADYESLKADVLAQDFTAAGVYEKYAALIDMQSLADYLATETILANSDFGNNNYALWKTETVDASRPYADGKWRFVLFDTEYGQGLYSQSNSSSETFQKLQQYANQDEWLPKLFIGLVKNCEEFRTLYLRCYFDQCNEYYNANTAVAKLDALETEYLPGLIETYNRFGYVGGGGWTFPGWGGGGGWDFPGIGGPQNPTDPADPGTTTPTDPTDSIKSEFSTIRSFWQQRDTNAKRLVLQWLGSTVSQQQLTVTVTQTPTQGSVKLNTLTLTDASWSGTYASDQPIVLNAAPKSGYVFDHWEVTGGTLSGKSASTYLTPNENAQTVTVKPVYVQGEGFTAADAHKLLDYLLAKGTLTSAEAARYDLDGNKRLNGADLTLLKRQIA